MQRKQFDDALYLDTHDLGELIQEFRPGIAVPVVSGLFSLFFFMAQSQMVLSEISSKPATEILRNSMQAFILVNIVFVFNILFSLFYLKTCLSIFKQGFIYKGLFKTHIIKFEDIQTLWSSFPSACYPIQAFNKSKLWDNIKYFGNIEYLKYSNYARHSHSWQEGLDADSFYLKTHSNSEVFISRLLNISQIKSLYEYIERGYFNCKFPQILKEYESGHSIFFGFCTLDLNGLVLNKKSKTNYPIKNIRFSWPEIQGLSIDKIHENRVYYCYVSIFISDGHRKRCVKIRMSQIANCNIFITLVLKSINPIELT